MAGTILLVDDDPVVRRILERYLSRLGYQVEQAGSGEELLKRLHHSLPDLVLLDLIMPGMDGYSLIAQIRSEPQFQNLPLLMVTGEPAHVHAPLAREVGVDGFVSKPFDFDELKRTIEVTLGR